MKKHLSAVCVTYLCLITMLFGTINAYAEVSIDDLRALLQKSLTIVEIDQEIDRLTVREEQVAEEIIQTQEQILQQEVLVKQTREQAGRVLRSYYMGEQESMWLLILSANSFSEALAVYEYTNMILMNNKVTLSAYQNSYKELDNKHKQLEKTQISLRQVKADFLVQRERALKLKAELDAKIMEVPEVAPIIQTQIADLKKEWVEKGIPVFRSYLSSMSGAMQSLPEILTGDNKDKYLKGLTFQISDRDLTQFFHSKDPKLMNVTFTFQNSFFLAEGIDGDVNVSIKGTYTVEQNPNRLQFRVEELTFNGFVLDETTNRALEQEFDLGFQPQKYVPVLQATDVSLLNGLLTIKLIIKL